MLLILLDDAGFAAMNTFGGPCTTPTADRLAAGGLTYSRFHVCALCAPTRAALLTGRNHHAVGMGTITEVATSAPGMNSMRPKSAAPLAEILKLNGYSTADIGKCHEVPVWQTSQMGPFDAWPTGRGGFEHFYRFLGAETDYYRPDLYQGTTPAEPPKTPEEGYHFDDDIATHTIDWVRQQKPLMPAKPFFVYFAPGGTHAPHAVHTEWSDKYKGYRDARVHGGADRQIWHAGGLQPLCGRLGARNGHALPMGEADRLALGRHAQRNDRALAQRISAGGERSAPSSAM